MNTIQTGPRDNNRRRRECAKLVGTTCTVAIPGSAVKAEDIKENVKSEERLCSPSKKPRLSHPAHVKSEAVFVPREDDLSSDEIEDRKSVV